MSVFKINDCPNLISLSIVSSNPSFNIFKQLMIPSQFNEIELLKYELIMPPLALESDINHNKSIQSMENDKMVMEHWISNTWKRLLHLKIILSVVSYHARPFIGKAYIDSLFYLFPVAFVF